MNLSPLPIQKFFDNAGRPLVGGKLFTYTAGSTTPVATYSDETGTLNTNPVVCDFRGECRVWLDPSLSYKFILSPADDTDPPTRPIWTVDQLESGITISSLTQELIGSILWPITPSEQSAGVAIVSYAYPPLDARRYGLIGSAIPDAAAWASWLLVTGASSSVFSQLDNYRWNRVEPTSFAIGKSALISSVLGDLENMAIGDSALATLNGSGGGSNGIANLAIGYSCCPTMTVGSFNTAVGINSMLLYTSGLGFNAVLGYGAYARGLTGYNNVAIGFEALHDNGAGTDNVAIGPGALHSGTNAASSPAAANPTASIGIGSATLKFAYGSANTAVGHNAGQGPVGYASGDNNCFFGSQVASNFTTYANSVVMGTQAGFTLTTGGNDVIIGYQARFSQTTSAGYNVAVGYQAGYYNTTATQNVAVGALALNGTSGSNGSGGNTAVGYGSMQLCQNGGANTAIGQLSLRNFTTGSNNTAAGNNALLNVSTGGTNTGIGDGVGGTLTTGSNNVLCGASADCTAAASNQNSFGYQATCTGDNQVTLGNGSIATLRCQVTTITAISDARFKKNIRPLEIPDEAMDDINVVLYEWINEDMPPGPQTGVIAQDLDAWQDKYGLAYLGLVDKTNPDRWEATPGKLLFPLITKVQQQSRLLANLLARVEALESK